MGGPNPCRPAPPYGGNLGPRSGDSSVDISPQRSDHMIRMLIERTASSVARLGPELEQGLSRDANFNFLHSSDPYHAYYQQCVSEYKEKEEMRLSKQMEKMMMMAAKIPAPTRAADDGMGLPWTRPAITGKEVSSAAKAEIEKKSLQ